MAKLSLEDYTKIIERFQNENYEIRDIVDLSKNDGTFTESIKKLINVGKKSITSLTRIFEEDKEVEISNIERYSSNIEKLLDTQGFAPSFLVKELSYGQIENFDKNKWASLTKSVDFKNLEYSDKKIVLNLANTFGIFEKDDEASNRLNTLIETLRKYPKENIKKLNEFEPVYRPHFLKFFKENKSLELEELSQIHKNWDGVENCVDIKTAENVQRYLRVANENKDEFETYMKYNNVLWLHKKKYQELYEMMKGRTKQSLPDVKKTLENGYSYEMLNFTDIGILRFGEKLNCCQKLGGVGETSMINSAIEQTSRAFMVKDEKGEPIAGSFMTQKIGKDGRSYVCFDSIEMRKQKLSIKAKEYSKALKRVEKLVKKGKIKSGNLEDIEEFIKNNHTQKEIGKKEYECLKTNKKIKDAYKDAIKEIIEEDKRIRDEQLKEGKITKEEHDRLLIKNGIITAGKNPVTMYLGDLPLMPKENMELLPAIQKNKSIYKKAHYLGNINEIIRTKIAIPTLKGMELLGIGVLLTEIALVIIGKQPQITGLGLGIGTVSPILGRLLQLPLERKSVGGTYTDARKEQRILYDGKENEIEKENESFSIDKLREKLAYSMNSIQKPIKISDLNSEQRKQFRRLREENGKEDYTKEDDNKYVIGNGKNWCATISRDGENITVNEIVTSNKLLYGPFSGVFDKDDFSKMADNQEELLKCLSCIASCCNQFDIKTENPKLNKYIERMLSRSISKEKNKTRGYNVSKDDKAFQERE